MIAVIAGNIDANLLYSSNLQYFPKKIMPFGFMTYQPYSLGPAPIIKLFAGGLKVGQEMSRARILGLSIDEARKIALQHSPADDFN